MVHFSRQHFQHTEGAKDYTLILVRAGSNSALIKRWGKVGAAGQVKIERGNASFLERQFNAEASKREARGYRRDGSVDGGEVTSFSEFITKARLGRVGSKLTALRTIFSGDVEVSVTADEPAPIPKAKPTTPEPERNDLWGSW